MDTLVSKKGNKEKSVLRGKNPYLRGGEKIVRIFRNITWQH